MLKCVYKHTKCSCQVLMCTVVHYNITWCLVVYDLEVKQNTQVTETIYTEQFVKRRHIVSPKNTRLPHLVYINSYGMLFIGGSMKSEMGLHG